MSLAPIDASLSRIAGGPGRESKIREMEAVMIQNPFVEYRATQTYIAKEEGEISFNRNEKICIISTDPSGWWTGKNEQGNQGLFPCVFVAQRPAGAPLPALQQSASHRPHLNIGSCGSWNSTCSIDERVAMIRSSPPDTFIGQVHFPFYSEKLFVEPGEIVSIAAMGRDDRHVLVRNMRGQSGPLPLNLLSVKSNHEKENLICW
jgi:hypothetical protein